MANQVLSRAQRATLEALAETLLPGGSGLASARSAGTANAFADYLAGCDTRTVRTLRLMLTAFNLSALGSRHMRPFHRLSQAARRSYIAECETSRVHQRREALVALKALLLMFYCGDREVARAINYDGSPLKPLMSRPRIDAVLAEEPAGAVSERVQVVIVGSGAGGAVMAKELAEAGLQVLVLEEGERFDRRDFQGPLPDRLRRLYRGNGLTFTLGVPVISLPMGIGVGGSTLVNSGTCFRTPEFVLASWRTTAGAHLDPDELAPIFDRVEGMLNVSEPAADALGPNAALLDRGRRALGYSGGVINRNQRGCHGHGVCAFGCPIDAKLGMHLTYLPAAVAAGARVLTRCRVTHVVMERGRAAGVKGFVRAADGRRLPLDVRADRVVLAAGAVGTPELLLRNRLANSSGQVGRNFRIHPGCGVLGVFESEMSAWRGVMQSYFVNERLRDGILVEATFPPPGVGYSAGSLPGSGEELQSLLARYGHTAALGLIVSDHGAGRVRTSAAGTLMLYRLGREDVRRVLEGIALAAELQLAAGAREVHTLLPGLPPLRHREQLRWVTEGRWTAADLKLSAYHPMGTCRMGSDRRTSVVDEFGQAHDVPGLTIADASILPGSTYVNPQITIMALATRAAARLAG